MPKKKKLVRSIAERDIFIDKLQQDIAELIERPDGYKASLVIGCYYIGKTMESAVWAGSPTANIPKL